MAIRLELQLYLDTLDADYMACLDALSESKNVVVVLSKQQPRDLSGVQLLCSFAKSLAARGHTLTITGEGAQEFILLWESFGMPGGLTLS